MFSRDFGIARFESNGSESPDSRFRIADSVPLRSRNLRHPSALLVLGESSKISKKSVFGPRFVLSSLSLQGFPDPYDFETFFLGHVRVVGRPALRLCENAQPQTS